MEIILVLIWVLGGLWAWSCIYYYQTFKTLDSRYVPPDWDRPQRLAK